MSAFFVDKKDIDLLVSALRQFDCAVPAFDDSYCRAKKMSPNELGKMLWAENVKSLRARYPNYENEHLEYDAIVNAYEFREFMDIKLAIANIAACYEYQTCEHSEWEASAACSAMNSLFRALAKQAAGDGPWGIVDERDLEKVCNPHAILLR